MVAGGVQGMVAGGVQGKVAGDRGVQGRVAGGVQRKAAGGVQGTVAEGGQPAVWGRPAPWGSPRLRLGQGWRTGETNLTKGHIARLKTNLQLFEAFFFPNGIADSTRPGRSL